jgi:hypothetical protein
VRHARTAPHWAPIVIAIASAPALAQESVTQIYGMLNVDFESVEAKGATAAGTLPAPDSPRGSRSNRASLSTPAEATSRRATPASD